MRIHEAELYPWINSLLQAAGLRTADAVLVADVFIRAARRELGHHDLHDLPGRLQRLYAKAINPTPVFTTLRDDPGLYLFDGDSGLGELCCGHAVRFAIERAQRCGIGAASVRHSNHFLAGFPYAQMGAEQGFLVTVYSNTDPSMTGPNGTVAAIGNNPVAFGAPGDSEIPDMILDTSMAYSSIGNLIALSHRGETIPGHWALNKDGKPTTDPQEALEGWRVRPIGEHKGFGLALMHEVMTAVMSGGETTTDISMPGGLNTHSHTVIAIAGQDTGRGLKRLSDQLAGQGLRLPGTADSSHEKESRQKGIHVRNATVHELLQWSETLGVPAPQKVSEA
ncbi:MAG: Ldh family oxidoreductase, partial [Spirochaeta sp.]